MNSNIMHLGGYAVSYLSPYIWREEREREGKREREGGIEREGERERERERTWFRSEGVAPH